MNGLIVLAAALACECESQVAFPRWGEKSVEKLLAVHVSVDKLKLAWKTALNVG